MPLQIVRNDITRMQADAIVNPTNPALRPGGGVDAAIHGAAGPALKDACRELVPLHPGTAGYTEGFGLSCRYIIHTVGPRFFDRNREDILRSCYRSVLNLAEELGCRSLAVPLIAAGTFGFPRTQALFIASEEIHAFLEHSSMEVTLAAFDEMTTEIAQKHFRNVRMYIDRHYAENRFRRRQQFFYVEDLPPLTRPDTDVLYSEPVFSPMEDTQPAAPVAAPSEPRPHPPLAAPAQKEKTQKDSQKPFLSGRESASISEDLLRKLRQMDESFSQMLLRKIDENHMTDSQCYKKAHIDRKLFSKIRSDPYYRPSKVTVLSFAVALELPLEEAKNLLNKAGFSLSPSSKFDVIMEYFLENRIYDLFLINEVLFEFDQCLLGV